MDVREKLVELLREVQYQGNAVHGYHDKYVQNGELADHLIANGVTTPVRCKDCDYYEKEHRGFGFCKYFDIGRADNDFCSSCIRKDGG